MNTGSTAADVYSGQQCMIVISKMREQYSTGHVADDLARQYAEQQSVYGQYLREKRVYTRYPGHITAKHKNAAKVAKSG